MQDEVSANCPPLHDDAKLSGDGGWGWGSETEIVGGPQTYTVTVLSSYTFSRAHCMRIKRSLEQVPNISKVTTDRVYL